MSAAPVVALALLFALDALSTIYVIERQGGREVNPVMVRLMGLLGVRGALLATKAAALVVAVYVGARVGALLWVLVALYVCVVAWNLYQIRRARVRAA